MRDEVRELATEIYAKKGKSKLKKIRAKAEERIREYFQTERQLRSSGRPGVKHMNPGRLREGAVAQLP